ncbi:hypothetical protein MIR68_009914 [Amoeboaphelidium protococcarum]|nr:hypothetical protein MIR68_009914 [Amoeboaphelidium protococcarum]
MLYKLSLFKIDCDQFALDDKALIDVFRMQLASHSQEKVSSPLLRDKEPGSSSNSLLQQLPKLKVDQVDVDYWDDQIIDQKPQQESEIVSVFVARQQVQRDFRYLELKFRIARHYQAVLGRAPPLRHFKGKLKQKIKDQLVGSTNVQTFDKLLLQSMRIESDLRQIKPQKSIDQALLSQAQSSKSSKTKVVCENCKKSGHEKKNCWAKGGGKEGQYSKFRQQNANTDGKCEKANVAAEAAQSVDVANAVSSSKRLGRDVQQRIG